MATNEMNTYALSMMQDVKWGTPADDSDEAAKNSAIALQSLMTKYANDAAAIQICADALDAGNADVGVIADFADSKRFAASLLYMQDNPTETPDAIRAKFNLDYAANIVDEVTRVVNAMLAENAGRRERDHAVVVAKFYAAIPTDTAEWQAAIDAAESYTKAYGEEAWHMYVKGSMEAVKDDEGNDTETTQAVVSPLEIRDFASTHTNTVKQGSKTTNTGNRGTRNPMTVHYADGSEVSYDSASQARQALTEVTSASSAEATAKAIGKAVETVAKVSQGEREWTRNDAGVMIQTK